MKYDEFKDKNVHLLFDTLVENFVNLKGNRDCNSFSSNKFCIQKCFVKNLAVIDCKLMALYFAVGIAYGFTYSKTV